MAEGDALEVLYLKDGQPIANQYVLAGHKANERELPPNAIGRENSGVMCSAFQ